MSITTVVAAGIFVYPYVFLADIIAMEKVEPPAGPQVLARRSFIHANPADPIYLVPEKYVVPSTRVAQTMSWTGALRQRGDLVRAVQRADLAGHAIGRALSKKKGPGL